MCLSVYVHIHTVTNLYQSAQLLRTLLCTHIHTYIYIYIYIFTCMYKSAQPLRVTIVYIYI